MIDLDLLFVRMSDIDPQDLERWIQKAWVRPDTGSGVLMFREIDLARIRLIQDLTCGMQVDEEALPIVLLLLDQLYDARRRMREVGEILVEIAPEEIRRRLLERLS